MWSISYFKYNLHLSKNSDAKWILVTNLRSPYLNLLFSIYLQGMSILYLCILRTMLSAVTSFHKKKSMIEVWINLQSTIKPLYHRIKIFNPLGILGSLLGHNLGRSSRLEVFYEKGLLKNIAKFTGKQLCPSLVFNKVVCLRLVDLIKMKHQHRNTSDGCFYLVLATCMFAL